MLNAFELGVARHDAIHDDAGAADQCRIQLERRIEPVPVETGEIGLDAAAQVVAKRGRALDGRVVPIAIQAYQSQEGLQRAERAAAPGCDHPRDDQADTAGIESSIDLTQA